VTDSGSQPHSSKHRYRKFRKEQAWRHVHDEDASPEPQPKAPPAARKTYLHRYRELIRPYRFAVGKLILIGMLAAACEMAFPAATGLIVDQILLNQWELSSSGQYLYLTFACLGVLALIILSRGLDTFRNIHTVALNHRFIVRLRRRLHRHLLHLPLAELYDLKTGTIVSRLSGDVDKATGLLQMAVMSPLAAFWRVLFASTILLVWNWKLALAAWAVLPPMIVVSLLWVHRIRPIFRSAGRDRNLIDARATETFSGIRVVRSFRRENRERRDYAVADDTMVRKRLFGFFNAQAVDSVWEILIPVAGILIVWIGGYLYIAGTTAGTTSGGTTIGQIMAFQAYTAQLLFPVFRIVSSLNQTQEGITAMERVFELFDKPIDKPDAPDAVEATADIRTFDFDHVNFAYGNGRPVITDFTLKVQGGSVIALVGPSGAGKSTITDLLARFYDPVSGQMRLNGIDIRKFKLDSYRRLLAVVPQETFLFDGTVRENISYGRRGVTDAQVADAARRANALNFIKELPEQFDTLIGERGVKLSGGQRQRIAIARAILADPRILILDEATSNLDTHSEQLIQQALDELYANRTTFVIAHRLSTVTHADLIVVMHEGRIVETGRHEELMLKQGMYYEMVERQRQFAAQAQGDLDAVR